MAPQSTDCLAAYKEGNLSLKDFEWEPHLRPSSALTTKASDFIIPEIDLQLLYDHHTSINQGSAQNPLQPNPGYANSVNSISHSAQNPLQPNPSYPSGYAVSVNRISHSAQNPSEPNPGFPNLVNNDSYSAQNPLQPRLGYANLVSSDSHSAQNPLQPNPGYPSGYAISVNSISHSAQNPAEPNPGFPNLASNNSQSSQNPAEPNPGFPNLVNNDSHSAQNPLQPNPGYSSGYANLVNRISQAASSYGFFQVFNHRISVSALEALYAYGCRFFSLPLERKYEVAELFVHPTAGPSGYICGNSADSPNKWWTEAVRVAATKKDVVQSLARCLFPNDEHEQQAFSDTMEECSNGFAKLAQDLNIVLMEGLGLNGKEMVEKYIEDKDIPGLKLCHYPACPQPNMTLGLPPHSDVSILTLLWQDQVGGLQVLIDGEWINVKPRHDALVVNIGDFFQVWSNDHYQSVKHRVLLNTRESRYSMVYFNYSRVDSMLAPIQELLEKTKECSKFQSTLMSEHRAYVYAEVTKRESQGVDYLKLAYKSI